MDFVAIPFCLLYDNPHIPALAVQYYGRGYCYRAVIISFMLAVFFNLDSSFQNFRDCWICSDNSSPCIGFSCLAFWSWQVIETVVNLVFIQLYFSENCCVHDAIWPQFVNGPLDHFS